jgi:CrcB protein
MLKTILCIALGSSLGGVARYFVSEFFKAHRWADLPLGTMAVNLAGCFLIGLFYALLEKSGSRYAHLQLILIVGFCGGFTTFSTFVNDMFQMARGGALLSQLLYLTLSVAGGYVCLYAGYAGTKLLA